MPGQFTVAVNRGANKYINNYTIAFAQKDILLNVNLLPGLIYEIIINEIIINNK